MSENKDVLLSLTEIEVLNDKEPSKLAFEYANKGTRFENIDILNMNYENKSIASIVSSKWHFNGFNKFEIENLKNPHQAISSMFSNKKEELVNNPNILNIEDENNVPLSINFAKDRYIFKMSTLNKLKLPHETALSMFKNERIIEDQNADNEMMGYLCLNTEFINKNKEVLSLKSKDGIILAEAMYLDENVDFKSIFLNYIDEKDALKLSSKMINNDYVFNLNELSDLKESLRNNIIKNINIEFTEKELLNCKDNNLVFEILKNQVKKGIELESSTLLDSKEENFFGFKKGENIKSIIQSKKNKI